jgi:LIVCS family branched-chain amino acid:cation transporter
MAGLDFYWHLLFNTGVFFGTPRTATISYEVITDGTGSSLMQKMIFSAAFFGLAGATLAKPGKLLEIVGFFLSPIKISALIFIGVCAGYTLLANSQQQQPRMKLARSVQDSSTVIRPWM